MKNIYETPVIEILVIEEDVITASGVPTGPSEGEQDVKDWYPDK